ncbi:MAG: hypothetical protein K9N40_12795, partial [Candidatus Cloacimonetes bacterium]|nr:hypothetical protein [Candidatus Cloacimonadota bacterium]
MRIVIFSIIIIFLSGCNQVNLVSSGSDIAKVIWNLPQHNNLVYQNKNTLDENFFEKAESTLDNGFLYIILSSTGSPAANLISTFTKQEYAHTSISFDENLETVVSYNGGNGIAAPGMNWETVDFFNQKEDASYIIYRLHANKDQKKQVLNKVRQINEQGSSYNFLGLFLPFKMRENIMYCSQFVYSLLITAGLDYFQIDPCKVQPIDFIRLDYDRKLEFCGTVF